jgi:hypothetical protein
MCLKRGQCRIKRSATLILHKEIRRELLEILAPVNNKSWLYFWAGRPNPNSSKAVWAQEALCTMYMKANQNIPPPAEN